MNVLNKLALLQEASAFDMEDSPQLLRPTPGSKERSYHIDGVTIPVTRASLPNGNTIPLLKTMLSNRCDRNCHYCAFHAERKAPRYSFQPEELADVFMHFYELKIAKGLFLSTGIAGGSVQAESRMLEVLEILRIKKQFKGYIHIKIMPGAEREQIHQAMLLADRVSINLEAPNAARLKTIAPNKDFERELFTRLVWIDDIRRTESPEKAWKGQWPSSTTQFVVGPAHETDLELLSLAERLFLDFHFSRTYFMAFRPLPDTPLSEHPAENPLRQLRLYQSSFLMRDYGFRFEELPFTDNGSLPLHEDPKVAAARSMFANGPVSINRAPREVLLRIPGIGPRSAARILRERRHGRIRDVSSLRKMGVSITRAAPFVEFNGSRPSFQLPLPFSTSSLEQEKCPQTTAGTSSLLTG